MRIELLINTQIYSITDIKLILKLGNLRDIRLGPAVTFLGSTLESVQGFSGRTQGCNITWTATNMI